MSFILFNISFYKNKFRVGGSYVVRPAFKNAIFLQPQKGGLFSQARKGATIVTVEKILDSTAQGVLETYSHLTLKRKGQAVDKLAKWRQVFV